MGDYEIELGSEENRSQYRYQLIKVVDTQGNPQEILTNSLKLPAWKVCLLYRYRWTIEILFRWIKRTLRVKTFVSYTTQGVQRQLLMALIVYRLLVLYRSGSPRPFSPTELLQELEIALSWRLYVAGYLQACLDKGLPPPARVAPLPALSWSRTGPLRSAPKEVPCRINGIQTT